MAHTRVRDNDTILIFSQKLYRLLWVRDTAFPFSPHNPVSPKTTKLWVSHPIL